MRCNAIKMILGVFVVMVLGLAGCGGDGSSSTSASAGSNGIEFETTKANAGPNQNIVVGSVVTFDGSQSTGANGSLITYQWSMASKPVGSNAILVKPTTVNPTITPDISGSYSFKLIVTDAKYITSEDIIIVTASVSNAAPVANAGTAQRVVTNSVVTLDGSGSSDANGDLLTYRWAFTSKPSGSSATLSNATVAKPTFTADIAGAYILNLVVNNGKVNSAVANVTVTSTDPMLLNTGYTARNGLTVTLTSLIIVDTGTYFNYTATYTQKNNTSGIIDEGQLKLYFNDGTGLSQYGFFGTLYPADTQSRTYTFKVLYTQIPTILEFDHDNFFASTPVTGSIQWVLPILN